jgi:Tfp pilus assembly protein PilF
MASDSFSALKKQLEVLFREGQVASVRSMLRKVNVKKVPRTHLVDFAALARRAQMPRLSLQLLSKVVTNTLPGQEAPTALEIATYGMSLVKLGAFEEAEGLLKRAVEKKSSEALLYMAFTYIHQWNYATAAQWLREYLKQPELSPYQEMTGKLNLASCYVYQGKFQSAHKLLAELRSTSHAREWRMIEVGAFELSTIAAISEQNFELGDKYLKQAVEASSTRGIDDLFLRKWEAVASLMKDGPNHVNLKQLSQVRASALTAGHWETVRDCDRYAGIAQRNIELVSKVYFGTPFSSYRKRLQELTSDWLVRPEFYLWSISEHQEGPVLDLKNGLLDGQTVLSIGSKPHLLLLALASDVYRPHLPGYLHARVYTGEVYDPESSWIRLFRLVERTRIILSKIGLPLKIDLKSGEFRLHATGPLRLLLSDHMTVPTPQFSDDNQIQILLSLKEKWPHQAFSTRQAAAHTFSSIESIRLALGEAMKHQRVLKIGNKRNTLYRFFASAKRKSAA